MGSEPRVRSAALTVDDGRSAFVLDLAGEGPDDDPSLAFLSCTDDECLPPLRLEAEVVGEHEAFLAAIAGFPGKDPVNVLARSLRNNHEYGTLSFVVDRSDARLLSVSAAVGAGLRRGDHGRSALVVDGAEAHACLTFGSGGQGDDVIVDHTDGGVWGNVRGAQDHVFRHDGVQDHCSLALRGDGTRVFAFHGSSDTVLVAVEDAIGVMAPGFPIVVAGRDGRRVDHPTVAVAPRPDGDVVHVVYEEGNPDQEGVAPRLWHQACPITPDHPCVDRAVWDQPVAVAPDLVFGDPPWGRVTADGQGVVYVAFVEVRPYDDDRVHVRARCPGEEGFHDLGVVDPDDGEQAFGGGAHSTANRLAPATPLAIDEVTGRVHLAYVVVEDGRSEAREAWRDLESCR